MEQEAKHSHTHWHRVEIREARSLRGEKRALGCYQKCSFACYPASTRCGNGCVTRYSFVTRSLSSRVKGLNTSCWLFLKDMRHKTQASTLSIWMKSVSWNLLRKLFRTWDDSRTDVSSFRFCPGLCSLQRRLCDERVTSLFERTSDLRWRLQF